jgi:hypothetical protein
MQNLFMRLTTHTAEEIIININQIVFLKKCTNHPNKPGEPELLTEIKLTTVENSIYVSDTIDELYNRIEDL